MKKKSLNKPGMKINGNSFLLMVTVLLFIVMYAAGMVIFADKGFAKPQMFLNLFISNAGLLVIAMGQTIVMITGGIDISVGSVTALVCMLCAYDMEKKGMSAYMAVAIALLIGLLFGIVQGFLVSYLEIQPFIVSLAGMFFGRGMTSIISTDMISKIRHSLHGLIIRFISQSDHTAVVENSSRHTYIRLLSSQY